MLQIYFNYIIRGRTGVCADFQLKPAIIIAGIGAVMIIVAGAGKWFTELLP